MLKGLEVSSSEMLNSTRSSVTTLRCLSPASPPDNPVFFNSDLSNIVLRVLRGGLATSGDNRG